MKRFLLLQIKISCILLALLCQSCFFSGDSVLVQRKKKQIGKYIIDMERTEWGEYEEEKDKYKDLTIVFKPNMTFEVSRSVPFLLDTNGQYVIRGAGKLSDIYFSSQIQKRGITRNGTWLWECWEISPGDSVTAIIGPVPQHNEYRQIKKLYFRKIGSI